MHDLNATQRDVLLVANNLVEPSGQDIRRQAENTGAFDELSHARLYPALDVLVDGGFMTKGKQDLRTNYYEVTEKGQEAIDAYAEFVEASR